MNPEKLRHQRSLLYRAHSSTDTAFSALERFAGETDRQLRCRLLLSEEETRTVVAAINSRLIGGGEEWAANDDETVFALTVSRTWGGKRPQTARGQCLFVRVPAPHVVLVFSDFPAAFWRHVLEWAIEGAYPRITSPSLVNKEMHHLLASLCRRLSASQDSCRVVRMLYKSRLGDPRARRAMDTELRWTDLDLSSAFMQVAELDAWIARLDFEMRGSGHAGGGALGRDGDMAAQGNWGAFHSSVIMGAVRIASIRFGQFTNRQRPLDAAVEARPFFIQYDGDVFDSAEANARLVQAIGELPNSSQSVIHSNPYLHLSLLDYLDGASCEIFVLDSTRITVVPQPHATPASLGRVYAHICRAFGEGVIVDHGEVYGE